MNRRRFLRLVAPLPLLPLVSVLTKDALAKPPAPTEYGTIDALMQDFSFRDISGGPKFTLSQEQGKRVVVLIFMGETCPMTWAYQQQFKDLIRDYTAKGVRIVGVHSLYEETDAGMKAQFKKHSLVMPLLDDRDQKLANYLGTMTVPSFFIVDKAGLLRYRGGMTPKGDEKTNYVRDALNAILAGKEVREKATDAYGCGIIRKGV